MSGQETSGRPELRDQIAEAAARWSLMYPIPAWQLLEGDRAEKLARSWGEGIADAVLATVQPELDARDAEIARVRKLADVGPSRKIAGHLYVRADLISAALDQLEDQPETP